MILPLQVCQSRRSRQERQFTTEQFNCPHSARRTFLYSSSNPHGQRMWDEQGHLLHPRILFRFPALLPAHRHQRSLPRLVVPVPGFLHESPPPTTHTRLSKHHVKTCLRELDLNQPTAGPFWLPPRLVLTIFASAWGSGRKRPKTDPVNVHRKTALNHAQYRASRSGKSKHERSDDLVGDCFHGGAK